jgi:hypothetical protein
MPNSIETIENPTQAKSSPVKYFFVWMASTFIVLTLLGFGFDYLILSSQGGQKVHWFTKIHGLIMGSWLLLMLTQTILAAKGNFKFHQQLGFISIGLATLVWLTMFIVSIRPIIANSPPIFAQDGSWDILLINFYQISLFGLFFIWGILVRKKAAMHKRLLYFTTLILIQASVDRIIFLPGLHDQIFGRFVYLDVLLIVPLFIYDFVTTKQFHKITITGAVIIIVMQAAITMAWGTPAWNKFCFNVFSPFTEKVVEVKLSNAQIKPLLGDYGDKNWHVTVSQEGDKFYLKLPDAPKFEMGAISENEWFLRTMTWKVSFIKGPDGRVIKLINKQPSVIWEVKRLR